MSNTDAKVQARRAQAEKLKKRNQRRQKNNVNVYFWKKFAGIAVACVCGLLVLGLIIPNLTITHRLAKAMRVGNETVSATEFSYVYQTQFSSYYQQTYYQYYYYYYYMTGSTPSSDTISNMMPISLYASLEKQTMSDGKTTYAEYFRDMAVETLSNMYALYQDALKNGKSLSEDDLKEIEEEIASLKKSAEEAEYTSFDRYLSVNFGKGMNEKALRSYMEKYTLANNWAEEIEASFEYTEDEVNAYYAQKADEYDLISMRYLSFAVSDTVDAATAKNNAEVFMSGISTSEDFSAKALEKAKSESETPDSVTTESTLHSDITPSSLKSTSQAMYDWLNEEGRKVGDLALVESKDADGEVNVYYVVFLVEGRHKDTSRIVNVDHLLIAPKDGTDEDEVEAIKVTLNNLMNELNALATEGKLNRDAFLEKVNAYKETDTRATVEELGDVTEGEMVATFNDWIFDESRKSLDMGIVETTYGYHLVFFNSDCGITWSNTVDEDMRTDDYQEYQTARKAEYQTTTYWFGTDLLREEPLPQ